MAVGARGLVATIRDGRTSIERRGSESLLAVACHQGVVAATSMDSALHVQRDGTWSQRAMPSRTLSLFVTPDGQWLAGASNGAVLRSDRADGEFAQVTGGAGRPALSFAAQSNGIIVAVGPFGTVLRSTDRGAHWAPSSLPSGDDLLSVIVDGALFRAVGTGGRAWSSADGVAWSADPGSISTRLLAMQRWRGKLVAVGDNGVIAERVGEGEWGTSAPERTTLFAVHTSGPSRLAVGRNGTLLRQRAAGAEWLPASSNATFDLRAIAWDGARRYIIVGDNGTILRSTDGGATFARVETGRTEPFYFAWTNAAGMVIAAGPGVLARSTDAGEHWTFSALPNRQAIGALAFDGATLWIGGDNGFLLRSDDMGVRWAPMTAPRQPHITRIVARARGHLWLFTKQSVVLELDRDQWREHPAPAEVVFSAASMGRGFIATSFGGAVFVGEGSPLRWRALEQRTRDSLFDVFVHGAREAHFVGEWGTILTYR